MILLPLPSPILRAGDDLVQALGLRQCMQQGDILVISSKAMATVEGAMIDLASMHVTVEARMWSEQTKRSPEFCQAVLQETERLNGTILRAVPGAMLTEVQPQGMTQGTILVANAGLDESNTEPGTAIGWPRDVVGSIQAMRAALSSSSSPLAPLPPAPTPTGEGDVLFCGCSSFAKNCAPLSRRSVARDGEGGWGGEEGEGIGLLLSDSVCTPRRRGVTAIALACCGIDPFHSTRGTEDLFGRKMTITVEATADQLATAANAVMGNTAQSIPAVIIRDHGLPFSDFCGWVEGIEKENDLFGEM